MTRMVMHLSWLINFGGTLTWGIWTCLHMLWWEEQIIHFMWQPSHLKGQAAWVRVQNLLSSELIHSGGASQGMGYTARAYINQPGLYRDSTTSFPILPRLHHELWKSFLYIIMNSTQSEETKNAVFHSSISFSWYLMLAQEQEFTSFGHCQ